MSMLLPTHVELYCSSVDLRKGSVGLLGLVEAQGREATDGTLYLFSNRSRSLVKGIFWDRTGYCVISKRLANGKFSVPVGDDVIELNSQRLRMLMDGLRLFL
jgi:transposase